MYIETGEIEMIRILVIVVCFMGFGMLLEKFTVEPAYFALYGVAFAAVALFFVMLKEMYK